MGPGADRLDRPAHHRSRRLGRTETLRGLANLANGFWAQPDLTLFLTTTNRKEERSFLRRYDDPFLPRVCGRDAAKFEPIFTHMASINSPSRDSARMEITALFSSECLRTPSPATRARLDFPMISASRATAGRCRCPARRRTSHDPIDMCCDGQGVSKSQNLSCQTPDRSQVEL